MVRRHPLPMAHHVLLIALGPVQELIASARKCRDLWFGSWALSEVSKAAAAAVADALGPEGHEAVVFPAAASRAELGPGSPMSVANKLVVRIEGDGAEVRRVAERGREGVKGRIRALAEEAFARVGDGDPARGERFFVERARAQVEEVYDYIWVAVAEGEGGYAAARREAERLLAARKNSRAFGQPPWASAGVPKSSLDGVRESVLREDIYDRPVTARAPVRAACVSAEERRRWYGVEGAERLCGVGLLKRWGRQGDAAGERNDRIFSTAHVAALPLMLGLDRDAQQGDREIEQAWAALRVAAADAIEELHVVPGRGTRLFGRVDGAVLFPQRLSESLEERGHDPRGKVTRAALAAQRALLDRGGRGEPIPYYGILVADGDSMGRRIDALATVDEHRDFSRRLDGFARDARRVVVEHDGCLIYSGGDDVLALLPLHQAVECGAALAREFHGATGGTLSAGLAIVHYTHPLDAALELARRTESEEAKLVDGKNALAVAVDKRSGGTTTVCGRWDSLAPRLLSLAELHAAEAIPDKAGYEIAELSRLGDGLRAVQRSEAIRILGRKRAKRGKEKVAKEALDRLVAHLGDDPADPSTLGRELAVAGLLAKAKAQALGREEGA